MTLIIYSGLYKLYDQHFGAKKFAVGSSLGKKKLQNNNNETIKQYRDAKNEKNLKKIIDYDNYTTVPDSVSSHWRMLLTGELNRSYIILSTTFNRLLK